MTKPLTNMRCGTVLGDAVQLSRGILAVHVHDESAKETVRVSLVECPAAKCIEREDSLCWDDQVALWSNRSRTVRDVEIKRAGGRK